MPTHGIKWLASALLHKVNTFCILYFYVFFWFSCEAQSTIQIRSLQILTELREWLYAWLARSTTACLAKNTSDLCSLGELFSLSLSVFLGTVLLPRVMDEVTESHARLEMA